jgi:flagellar basal-body rod protein FlgF
MDKMIYVAMTGAKSVLQRQDNLAANLANVNTPGYRAATAAYRSFALEQAATGAAPAAPGTQVFAVESTAGADLSMGPVQRTGRPLDVAVQGDGWIAVQGNDGREAYTRSGALEVGAGGLLQAPGGRPVLGEGGPIAVPPDSILTIAPDGTVSSQTNGAPLSEVQTLGRIKLVNPPGKDLVRSADGLFRTAKGTPADADAAVTLTAGAVEGSNVNAVEAMVGMISAARQFEMHMKLLQTAETNSRSAGQLLQLNG